jgi:hypothetical protein
MVGLSSFAGSGDEKSIAKIGYSIFVHDLSNDPDGLARLKETYIKTGATPP